MYIVALHILVVQVYRDENVKNILAPGMAGRWDTWHFFSGISGATGAIDANSPVLRAFPQL